MTHAIVFQIDSNLNDHTTQVDILSM